MIETITPDNYAEMLERTVGYLVNVTPGERAVAHILAHMDGNCRVQMTPCP